MLRTRPSRPSFFPAAVVLPMSLVCLLGACAPQPEVEDRSFTVLAINDVYRLTGVGAGSRGGLARFRTLRAELERSDPELLVLHAGDILYPSMLSRYFDGEQMIDIMNRLDGDPAAFDERFFITFGNHEFEKRRLEQASILASRVHESQFTWLGTDLHFALDEMGEPLIGGENLVRSRVTESGGVKVGIFSLTTDMVHPAYIESFDDPLETARRLSRELREQGAEVVIALTHLPAHLDVQLLEAFEPGEGPDVVLGGHEHERQAYEVDGRWVIKADADAVSATVLSIQVNGAGEVGVDHRWEVLEGDRPEPDPEILAAAESWQEQFDEIFCAQKRGLPLDCLDETIGVAGVELTGEELTIRRFESNLGNWVTDLMLEAFADEGAQIAFINGGSLRLNDNLPAGTRITRRHLEGLFAYPAPLQLIEIDGATLHEVTERAVEVWSGNGWWLQIAGFAFRQEPDEQKTYDLTLLAPDGARPIAADEMLRAVTVGFLMNPELGQDGFTMLEPDQIVRAQGPDLKDLVITALREAGSEGVSPQLEGRICHPRKTESCLAMAPAE